MLASVLYRRREVASKRTSPWRWRRRCFSRASRLCSVKSSMGFQRPRRRESGIQKMNEDAEHLRGLAQVIILRLMADDLALQLQEPPVGAGGHRAENSPGLH